MKISATFIFITILFITCSKEKAVNKLNDDAFNKSVLFTDTLRIPLNDLGTGTFHDSVGGLYPAGANLPSGDYANDLLKICKKITPLDSFGSASEANGRIVFISMGGSTSGHLMKELKAKCLDNPLVNPELALLNCSNGYGQASLNSIVNPNDIYWGHVTDVLHGAGGSYRQVQVIYLETDDSTGYRAFPGRPNLVKGELEEALRVIKQKFENIKVVYVLGRTRTFGNQQLQNREPAPYFFGWACKWVIQDQINNVKEVRYKGKKAVAPILTWGFYEWADSLPRITDGFSWRSTDTRDGLHASDAGEDTLATRFQNFLLTDKYAKKWFAANP